MGRKALELERFRDRLQAALGEDLVSLVLFGSAVRGPDRERASPDLLLIMRRASVAALRPAATAIAAWTKSGHPAPRIFSEAGWRRSADVFPIEIEDMREAHRVLAGRDPFEGLSTDRADLRRELEHEVRGKLLRLRTEYATAAPHGKALTALLLGSAGTFHVLMRAVLRLEGIAPPADPGELVRRAAGTAGFDPGPFLWVADHAARRSKARLQPFDETAQAYLAAVERLATYVDGLEDSAQEETA
jgi:hypothetical protein